MKLRNIFFASIVCILMYSFNVNASDYDIKYIDAKLNVAQNKSWTVKFSKELDTNTVTEENIQVLDSSGQVVPITLSLSNDNMSVSVLPDSSYEKGETYTLCVKKAVLSKSSNELSKEVRMEFTITKSSTDDSGSSNNTDSDLVEAVNKMDTIKKAVKTQPEKNLVTSIKSALTEKINDTSTEVDIAPIKSQYNNLSDEEKSDFKNVFLSNIPMGTLSKIWGLFQ